MDARPFVLAVKAVIIDDQRRCLLIRRSPHNRTWIGKWEWPGGKPDPGEGYAEALVRETREETGLDVEITGLAGATQFEMPKVNVVQLCMETRRIGGDLRLSEEHDAVDWVPLGDVGCRELVPVVAEFMIDYARRESAAQ
jgi:mutator protein MutT